MRQVLVRQGKPLVEDVPAPTLEPGTILIRTAYSCVSIGTELSGMRASGQSIWQRALRQPEKARKLMKMAATQGIAATRAKIEERLSAAIPLGYSAAGVVLEVGEGIDGIRPGDRVACAGSQYAFHAEILRVPRNLVVAVPEALGLADASSVALGAIALQGVRRANPTLGECFVVIGLGLLGQLAMQMLKACGCRVIGTDLDVGRIEFARRFGMVAPLEHNGDQPVAQVHRLTGGLGADGVIVTAATTANDVVSAAFHMCRRKGRVILVGDVGLDLDRADLYAKELDLLISTSYGPGRYDERYEERGQDYPVAYVRWTENRNMEEYLRLLAEELVTVAPFASTNYPIEQASDAYESLKGANKPLMVRLCYPEVDLSTPVSRRLPNSQVRASGKGRAIRIAVIGVGNFAKGVHLPNLRDLSDRYEIRAVVARTGHHAAETARLFGAGYAATDLGEALADPDVDAVLIATRHHLHASMALAALRAGKHVLLEKPLSLSRSDLTAIKDFYATADDGGPVLMTGFNRRFSPYARRLRELVAGRGHPMILNYQVNAGYIPLDHWVHGAEGGGRNLGEACHIYDLFTFLTDSRVQTIQAACLRPATGYYSALDNFVTTLTFEDGSVGTLTYTALGTTEHPKERMEIYSQGRVIVLDDYRRLQVAGAPTAGLRTRTPEKGLREELIVFADAVRKGGPWPIPFWQQVQATEIALEVEQCLRSTGTSTHATQ